MKRVVRAVDGLCAGCEGEALAERRALRHDYTIVAVVTLLVLLLVGGLHVWDPRYQNQQGIPTELR